MGTRPSAWGKYHGDATVTAAVLERLAMTAVRLDIDGPSYRQHLAHQRADACTGGVARLESRLGAAVAARLFGLLSGPHERGPARA